MLCSLGRSAHGGDMEWLNRVLLHLFELGDQTGIKCGMFESSYTKNHPLSPSQNSELAPRDADCSLGQ